MFLLQYF